MVYRFEGDALVDPVPVIRQPKDGEVTCQGMDDLRLERAGDQNTKEDL